MEEKKMTWQSGALISSILDIVATAEVRTPEELDDVIEHFEEWKNETDPEEQECLDAIVKFLNTLKDRED